MNWNWKFRAVWILCLGVNDMSREMKDSGVEWLGEIPEDWEITKLKYLGTYINGYAFKPDDWGNTGIRIIRIQDLTGSNDKPNYYSGNLDNKYLIKKGDILVSWAATLEAFIWKKDYGWLNQHIFKALPNEESISPEYFFWLLKVVMENMNNDNKHGIFMQHVTLGIFNNFFAPLPNKYEQKKIADFLDGQCEKINLAIEKSKVAIEEYRNLKQSFITQIVTKGINENDTMKESGTEWIGKIPASWKVTQLRHCASIRSGITLGKTYSKYTELVEMPYLRVANVQDGYVDTNDIAVLQVSKDEIEKYSISAGEVLMTEGGDRDKLGRGCVWDGRITPCLHQNHIFAVKVKEKLLNPYYLEYLTASSVGRTYFDVTAVKTTNLACTSSSKVLAFTIPLPSIDEQNEIVDYLKEKCGCIETVIFKKEQFISELENYKKSLIYEYVTGKKEVPES